MDKKLFFLIIFCFSLKGFGQKISGKVVADGDTGMHSVLIVNINLDEKTHTDFDGNFSLNGKAGDELRFVREGYERKSLILTDVDHLITVNLMPVARPITEVNLGPRLTGDLSKDSKLLNKTDKTDQLRKEIGMAPAEKPREVPADLKKDVLLPVLTGSLNVQALYDVVSGDARRKKSLYQYEDRQENISWVVRNLGTAYFEQCGIPNEKIYLFVEYAIYKNPDISKYIKEKKLSAVQMRLDELVADYLKTLNK